MEENFSIEFYCRLHMVQILMDETDIEFINNLLNVKDDLVENHIDVNGAINVIDELIYNRKGLKKDFTKLFNNTKADNADGKEFILYFIFSLINHGINKTLEENNMECNLVQLM